MKNIKIIYNDVIQFIKENVPLVYSYHHVEHTKYVFEKAVYIAQKEKVSNEQIVLLQLASLYHDVGFSINAAHHEEESCKIAQIELPKYGVPPQDIQIICELIRSTKTTQNPVNQLENIINDADLYYLSTPEAPIWSEKLKNEWLLTIPNFNDDKWTNVSNEFIKSFRYHSNYCKKYRQKLIAKYNI
jgi:uncharacterized protein